MSIDDMTSDEFQCKVSDGNHWVTAVFHRQFAMSFQTDRIKENHILRLVNCSLDRMHTLKIVRPDYQILSY